MRLRKYLKIMNNRTEIRNLTISISNFEFVSKFVFLSFRIINYNLI